MSYENWVNYALWWNLPLQTLMRLKLVWMFMWYAIGFDSMNWAYTKCVTSSAETIPHKKESWTMFLLHKEPDFNCKLQGDSGGLGVGLGWLRFEMFPRFVGSYCSYLLPKQDGGRSQIQVNATQLRVHQNHAVASSAVRSPKRSIHLRTSRDCIGGVGGLRVREEAGRGSSWSGRGKFWSNGAWARGRRRRGEGGSDDPKSKSTK